MSFKTDLRADFDALVGVLTQSEGAETRKVLLVGQRGAGKTSFLRLLEGLDGIAHNKVDSDKICRLHAAAPGATKQAAEVQISLGEDGPPLTIIDVPGWQDTEGTGNEGQEDQEHSKGLREAAASAQYLHCVILVVNGTLARLQPSIDHSLRELEKIYPSEDIRQRVVVLFTFCDSLQRCVFPVSEDRGLLGEIGRQEHLCFHLDNPLGRLAGLEKRVLEGQLADESDESAAEIHREVKKGAQVAVKLLKRVSSSSLSSPARVKPQPASVASSFITSFGNPFGGSSDASAAPAAPAAPVTPDFRRPKDPEVQMLPVFCLVASAVAVPFLILLSILCLQGSHMIELPEAQKESAGFGCLGAAVLYAITLGLSYWQINKSSAPQARDLQYVEMATVDR